MVIQKSQFLKGINCSRFLYLDLFLKDLGVADNTVNSLHLKHGKDVEDVVYKQYFDGVNVYDKSLSLGDLFKKTLDAIESGAPVIYQPTFISKDGRFAFRGDLLVKFGKKYRLLEVKSSTKIKEMKHILDVGFQKMVLDSYNESVIVETQNQYKYKSRKRKHHIYGNIEIFIVHLNGEYVFDGTLQIDELLIEENVTSRAKDCLSIIKRAMKILDNAIEKSKIPDLTVGKHCIEPSKCKFYDYCWKNVPKKSLHRTSTLSDGKINKLIDKGITTVDEIPPNFSISETARIEIAAEISRKEVVKYGKLGNFLKQIDGKNLLFLDFESVMSAVPNCIGTRPYQQMCFQYSIIEMESIYSETSVRKEFLAEPGYDSRLEFIESLLNDTQGNSKIIVYNRAFEASRLKELALAFPKYDTEITNRINRIVDLMVPFRDKLYYHKKFEGGYSIKKVAPVMCPEISYQNLEVQNGNTAMMVFSAMAKMNSEKRHLARRALLEYCYTDVLSMVHILRNLFKISKKEAA